MAAGAAVAVVGWWTGYKLGGVIALNLAEYFENLGIINYWQMSFVGLGLIVILFNIGLLFIKEKDLYYQYHGFYQDIHAFIVTKSTSKNHN